MLDREVVEDFLDWEWIRERLTTHEKQRDCRRIRGYC
jgi:hypothetical protein